MTIEKLANIKINLIKDPVEQARAMQQTVKGPSIVRTAINSLIIAGLMGGRGGIRRPVNIRPMPRPIPIPQPKPIAQPIVPRLPSTSWNRATLPDDSIRNEVRIAASRSGPLLNTKQLQKGLAPRSIDSSFRTVAQQKILPYKVKRPQRVDLSRQTVVKPKLSTHVMDDEGNLRLRSTGELLIQPDQNKKIILPPVRGQFSINPETSENMIRIMRNEGTLKDNIRHRENIQ